MPNQPSKFFHCHLLYPLLALALISTCIVLLNIDQRLADYFYALQGGKWQWKNLWLTETLLHKGGRSLSIGLAVAVLVYLLVSACRISSEKTKPLAYLFFAIAGSSLLVSLFKSALGVSCPWEFSRYGGALAYSNLVEQIFLRNGEGCFPAGHASAGYAWIALYFFGLSLQSQWRWLGLAAALTAGIIFGVAQQVRGAHFISHDIWTLAVCWFFSLALYLLMFRDIRKSIIRDEYAYKTSLTNNQ